MNYSLREYVSYCASHGIFAYGKYVALRWARSLRALRLVEMTMGEDGLGEQALRKKNEVEDKISDC